MMPDAELMAEATAAAGGLSDFGPEDGFRTSLRILLADLDAADLEPARRGALRDTWRGRLETRLHLMALRAERPEIAAQHIAGPLMVTGLPRTGTTSLFDILAQDPAARAPLTWETMTLGRPAERGHWHDDHRIAEIDRYLASLGDPVAQAGLHTYGAMLPDECNNIHLYNFWGARYPGEPEAVYLKGASQWIHKCMPRRPYAMHKIILQHLQTHGPSGRWILKEPFHINALGEFLAEYPDAMIVQTHRDPIAVFTSLAGLYATIRGEGPGHPGRAATGRYVLERWGTSINRCLAARLDPALDARILDIGQRQIIQEPMKTVAAVYERFDLPFLPTARERMARWIANPAQHESTTRFNLAEFELTENDVETVVAPYRQRFQAYF
jgi:hypothetical protein